MKHIKIIRIENKQGEGPYLNKHTHKNRAWKKQWMESTHTDSSHPEPFDDEGLIKHMENPEFFLNDYLCAFKNKTQMKKWFSKKEINNLKNLGFEPVEYSVSLEDVLIGTHQVLIKK